MTQEQIRIVTEARQSGVSWAAAASKAGVSAYVARNWLDPQWAARRRELNAGYQKKWRSRTKENAANPQAEGLLRSKPEGAKP